jgi:hypothetical protein
MIGHFMRIAHYIVFSAYAFACVGCGNTYVDSKRNFERAFQTKCPKDVEVIHSVFSGTFKEDHEYYFQIKASAGSDILRKLTNGRPGIVQSLDALEKSPLPFYLKLWVEQPEWFAPNGLTNYNIWYSTNTAFIVLRDRGNAEIFVYGNVGF